MAEEGRRNRNKEQKPRAPRVHAESISQTSDRYRLLLNVKTRHSTRRSSVHEVIAGPRNARVHLGAHDAAQAVLELEVLDDGTEAVAAHFGV